ncbi:MAG: helix-turn-helix domain-containing protein [Clostridiales bacterium]|nr:helix-turn-helix domain-containing protein [Clostridiales bacterium]
MLTKRLKEERHLLGLSQKDLAKKIGVSQQTVGSWETGRTEPDQNSLKLLSDCFNVSLDYLMGVTNQKRGVSPQTKDYNDFMENVKIQFMDASEKDRDAIYKKISELYWDAKEKYDNQNK